MNSSNSTATLASLCKAIVDNRGRTCPTSSNGRPLIATNCISNDGLYPTYDTKRFVDDNTYRTWFRGHPEPGDLLLVLKGSPGRVAVVPDPVDFCVAQDMVAIRPDESKVYPPFLLALLRSPAVQSRIEQMHVGTLIPHFKKGDFDKLLLPLPDRQTQRSVGDMYFSLSEKIELNRRLNRTLESIARAIFKSWFVDFDPVRTKMEGAEVGLPPALAAEFPDRLVSSSVGPVPRGWDVVAIGELASLDKGVSYKGAFLGAGGVPMVNLGCFLGSGRFDSEKVKGYSGDYRERHRAVPGDLLVANTDMTQRREVLGSPALVPWTVGEQFIFSHHVYAVRLEEDASHLRRFVYFSLLSQQFRDRAEGFATGTTVLGLPREAILGYELVLPPPAAVERFNHLIESLDGLRELHMAESSTLAELRDHLLPRLTDGELLTGER